MSVASRNPFALLGDEDGPAPAAAAAPAKAKQADAAPVRRNIPGSGGNNSNNANANGNGAARQQGGARGAGRGGARGGRQGEAGAAAGGEEDSPSQRDGRSNRGRGADARGGRGRGAGGRGRGRQFDRHSQTGREDSNKNLHQGWGGDDPKREIAVEENARADAEAEGGNSTKPSSEAAAGEANGWDAAAADGEAKPVDGASASTPLAPVEEEKDNTKTLDEYLAEQAAKRAQIGAKKEARQADTIDASALGKKVEHSRGEDFYSVQKDQKHRQRERKEKATLEIEQTFNSPAVRPPPGRGGARGGARGGRGGERGSERGGRGRGAGRGGRGGRSAGPTVNLADQSAFPTLGN